VRVCLQVNLLVVPQLHPAHINAVNLLQDFSSSPAVEFAMAMAEPESDEMSAADIKVCRPLQTESFLAAPQIQAAAPKLTQLVWGEQACRIPQQWQLVGHVCQVLAAQHVSGTAAPCMCTHALSSAAAAVVCACTPGWYVDAGWYVCMLAGSAAGLLLRH
jgi:hypothetical protein